MQKQHDNVILELTVRNHPGVMTHVCGLFARRAFNVEGILCLPIQGSEHSRICSTRCCSRRISSGRALGSP
jgi:acetolactate synthase-1/3 small subunit